MSLLDVDSMLSNFKITTMEQDTTLAEEYVKSMVKLIKLERHNVDVFGQLDIFENCSTLLSKITENTELFVQLEYMQCKKPQDEVKKFDIAMIQESIEHWQFTYKPFCGQYIVNVEDCPLGFLGALVPLMAQAPVYVKAINCSPALHLFISLCKSAGFAIGLNDSPLDETFGNEIVHIPGTRTDCIGVITEHADKESALDTFIYSTTHYPWQVTRIFVQECIYEDCKKMLAAKQGCHLVEDENAKWTALFQINSKQFAFDYVGSNGESNKYIFVETYRTTKELLGLLKKKKSLYLSVWSHDIAEANEIAFKSNQSIVWINEYASFMKQVTLCVLENCYEFKANLSCDVASIEKKHDRWLQLSLAERQKSLLNLTKGFTFCEGITNLNISNLSQNDVCTGEGYFCVNLSRPAKILLLCDHYNYNYFSDLISALIRGNFVFSNVGHPEIDKLIEKDLPICKYKRGKTNSLDVFDVDLNRAKCSKVVLTSFGTIFAN